MHGNQIPMKHQFVHTLTKGHNSETENVRYLKTKLDLYFLCQKLVKQI